jgi:hypothetical protein
MITRLVRWLGHWFAGPRRRHAPDDDIGAYI